MVLVLIADSAMELMQENIELNASSTEDRDGSEERSSAAETETAGLDAGIMPTGFPKVEARVLDWDEPLPDWVISSLPRLVV
jgi:hypothetical protein